MITNAPLFAGIVIERLIPKSRLSMTSWPVTVEFKLVVAIFKPTSTRIKEAALPIFPFGSAVTINEFEMSWVGKVLTLNLLFISKSFVGATGFTPTWALSK